VHRYPATIISHCVWLYFRFPLSYCDVKDMMAERGIVVSDETIRTWCDQFGRQYARQIRLRRALTRDTRPLDEGFLRINDRQQRL